MQPTLTKIDRKSGIPLIGSISFGIIDRGTNILQVRATSLCNMKCQFCSTSWGDFELHPTQFIVEPKYMLEEVKKVCKIKGPGVIIFLDSVGEPTSHPDFVKLVSGLKKISEVSEIVAISNGTFLSKKMVQELEKAGLTRINVSLHSLDPNHSKKLFGMDSYNIKKVLEGLRNVSKSKIELMITPVWLPTINDSDVEDVIKFAKEINAQLGIQKYEVYPFSRKLRGAKKVNYWKFYNQLRKWEDKFKVKLIVKKADLNVESRPRIPEIFSKKDKTSVVIKSFGWFANQRIGVAKDRCITVNKCSADIGDRVNVKVVESKNNLYIAEQF